MLREISAQLVEEFKNNRLNTPTKKNTPIRPATVNRELISLSSAFSLAVKYDKAESNPSAKVGLDTQVRVTMRYVRAVGISKRVAVEAVRLIPEKLVVLAS